MCASQADVFEAAAARKRAESDVEPGTGFGANPGLRSGGKIFAFLSEGQLVVKLSADRCSSLVQQGKASSFAIGSRRMREWVRIPADAEAEWEALMREARTYVSG
jgi:hypothetical protein